MCVRNFLVFWRRIFKSKSSSFYCPCVKLNESTPSITLTLFLPYIATSHLPPPLSSPLYPLHHPLPWIPPCPPSLPKSPSIHPSLPHISLFIPLKGKYHGEFGRYSKDREWAERERERERDWAEERQSIRGKKRGKEERRARTKTPSHLILGWRFVFAVNNLLRPLFCCVFCIW